VPGGVPFRIREYRMGSWRFFPPIGVIRGLLAAVIVLHAEGL
jgi:hypothetical protein